MAKKGSDTQTVELDPRIEEGAVQTLAAAMQAAGLPYRPNRGITIADFTPQQQAAFTGANEAASAFGLPSVANPMTTMPQAQIAANGIQGFSSGDLFDEGTLASLSGQDMANIQQILSNYISIGTALQNSGNFSPDTNAPAVVNTPQGQSPVIPPAGQGPGTDINGVPITPVAPAAPSLGSGPIPIDPGTGYPAYQGP